jgi:hypothetical protein
VTPEQIHDDLQRLRESLDRYRDDSHAGREKLNERITALQVQVGAISAQRDFAASAMQAMIRTGIIDALSEHERRMDGRVAEVTKRLDALEHDRSRREGMTTAAKVALTLANLPGIGAFFYLVGKALGFGNHAP